MRPVLNKDDAETLKKTKAAWIYVCILYSFKVCKCFNGCYCELRTFTNICLRLISLNIFIIKFCQTNEVLIEYFLESSSLLWLASFSRINIPLDTKLITVIRAWWFTVAADPLRKYKQPSHRLISREKIHPMTFNTQFPPCSSSPRAKFSRVNHLSRWRLMDDRQALAFPRGGAIRPAEMSAWWMSWKFL